MDELAKFLLFSSVAYHEPGLPARFADIQYVKLYNVNGEGADDWDTILFHNNNKKEEWFYTWLHSNGQNGYCRTTSGGRRWHSRGKTDKLLGECLIKRTRFTLKYKNPTRGMPSSDAYTMFEHTIVGDDKFALCKIIRNKKRANGIGRFWSSKQSTELIPSLHAVNSPIMGTNHGHGNNTNFHKDELSGSLTADFMQEDGIVNGENEAADEIIHSVFKAQSSVDDNTIWQSDQNNHVVLDDSMNNRNCSGTEIKEPTGLIQNNDWSTFSPLWNDDSEMKINEAISSNSNHALQTSMLVTNNLIDSSQACVGYCPQISTSLDLTDFPSSSFQPNVGVSFSFEDWGNKPDFNITTCIQFEDYSGDLLNYRD